MTAWRVVVARPGRMQTGAALGLAALSGGIIVVSSWNQTEIAGRLAIGSFALFAVALTVGSSRLVGLAALAMLGAALIASEAAPGQSWVRSVVLGCVLYVAAELSWEAIERRDGADCSVALDNRRSEEVATVVVLSLVTTTAGLLLSFLAPTRSIVVVGLATLAVLGVLNWATRRLVG